ncbi:MAG: class IV adenylate cyclase [Kiritimatiellae bacterium]|nr:class IV adenylate cyclase [Kiritimatiellia bacterium]
MPANVEVKARAGDYHALTARAAALSDTPARIIRQEDTFFDTPRGRLKLRVFSPESGELIYYERPDSAGPKPSTYLVARTDTPALLADGLRAAFGVKGIVRKERTLYMAGQTRIHLDRVEGLGRFVELEVVLQPGQTPADGARIAEALMAELGIRDADLIEGAYLDLLAAPRTGGFPD